MLKHIIAQIMFIRETLPRRLAILAKVCIRLYASLISVN